MFTVTTRTRTFVGETATAVGDSYAGFRKGRQYQLRYERRGHGTVALNYHEHVSPGAGPMVVREAQFEKWFVKG